MASCLSEHGLHELNGINVEVKNTMNFPVEIIDYRPEYIGDFRGLNLEWLNRYKLAESHDLAVLKDPKAMILDPGGFIWLAYCDNMVVGSAALIKVGEGEFELAKMAVAPA